MQFELFPNICTPVQALIDTGSEVNLIRQGLLLAKSFRPTANPVTFLAANQTMVEGGRLEVEGKLLMEGCEVDTKQIS